MLQKIKRRFNRKGQAAIETALTLPLFIFLILALLDFGLFMTAKFESAVGAHQAARVATVQGITKGEQAGDKFTQGKGTFSSSLQPTICKYKKYNNSSETKIGTPIQCSVALRYKPFSPWLRGEFETITTMDGILESL